MMQTPCDECGKPITSKARLEAGISFCSEACEFEDERKSCKRFGLEPSYPLERHDETVVQDLSEHLSEIVLRDEFVDSSVALYPEQCLCSLCVYT